MEKHSPTEGCSHEHHDHSNHQPGMHVHPITKNLKVAFFLNLTFTIVEIIGGLMTNSIAILSDAIHDFGDTLAIGAAYYFEKLSDKKRDNQFSYGYRRLSTLAALLNVVILTTGSVVIITQTIPRLLAPEEVNGLGMIGFAILGVIMNGIAVLRLRSNSKSLNQRTVMLHLLEDVLGWGAVLVASIVIYFTNWYILDPILSMLIAGYILFNALKNLKSIMHIFLQAIPNDVNVQEIRHLALNIDGVQEVNDLHVWSLDGEFNIASMHVFYVAEFNLGKSEWLKSEIRKLFAEKGIEHVTIELEGPGNGQGILNSSFH
jgi:cobalt-zinc-cadmium efflux system protein|tara:strand:+ start:9917 stop:10867 length:951 start_codon:yes stop_codon:yes gene_type:complete